MKHGLLGLRLSDFGCDDSSFEIPWGRRFEAENARPGFWVGWKVFVRYNLESVVTSDWSWTMVQGPVDETAAAA